MSNTNTKITKNATGYDVRVDGVLVGTVEKKTVRSTVMSTGQWSYAIGHTETVRWFATKVDGTRLNKRVGSQTRKDAVRLLTNVG